MDGNNNAIHNDRHDCYDSYSENGLDPTGIIPGGHLQPVPSLLLDGTSTVRQQSTFGWGLNSPSAVYFYVDNLRNTSVREHDWRNTLRMWFR